MNSTSTAVYGIRHHGPGSARSVRAALAGQRPDIVLIEGPPEADDLVALAADPDMRPPVALLGYVPGEPRQAAFWPFAVFSPEWQAITYALDAGIPVRFCDLPAHQAMADLLGAEGRDEITFGKLKLLDLGDLTWDKEMQLMCPTNRLGHVDVYIVSHHGWLQSSSPALVHAIHARVAIMDNGSKKGGAPSAWDIVKSSPGLQDLWQLHFANEGGAEHNTSDPFIANVEEADTGFYLKVTAHPDGSFDLDFGFRALDTRHLVFLSPSGERCDFGREPSHEACELRFRFHSSEPDVPQR